MAPSTQPALTRPKTPVKTGTGGGAKGRGDGAEETAPAGFVRRTPAHVIFHRCGVTLSEAVVLDMRRARLETLHGFDLCTSVVVLLASHNQLPSLDGVGGCRQLWRLDVSHNKLTSLEGLSSFAALGCVNVEHNNLTWGALQPLARVNVIQLELREGNPRLAAGLTELQYRACVITLLPRLWVLDGQFITEEERARAVEWAAGDGALPEDVVTARDQAATRAEMWVPAQSTGHDAEMLGSIMAHEPIRPDLRDSYRLRAVSQFYMRACKVVNEYAAAHPKKLGEQTLRMPELHTRCLLPLSLQDQADICVLLSGVAEYGAPQVVRCCRARGGQRRVAYVAWRGVVGRRFYARAADTLVFVLAA